MDAASNEEVPAEWVAIAYGALDVTRRADFREGTEFLVVPASSGAPLALFSDGATLWRRLLSGPVPDLELSEGERTIVREMEDAGLASRDAAHLARICEVPEPWLSSPLHELVYALVQRVAREHGLEVIFIKGPVLQRQDIREKEHSGDVDVWVQPGSERTLADLLGPWGWRVVPFDFASAMYHSLTLEPPDWGCEIDLHYRYPGIGAAPSDAFALFAETAETFEFGGVEAKVPSRELGAIIAALHRIRPDPGRPVTAQEQAEASAMLQRAGEGTIAYADRCDALPVLRDTFRVAFPATALPPERGHLPDDWVRRQAPTSFAYHVAIVRSLPWRERPRAALLAIWPRSDAAVASDSRRARPSRSSIGARLSRLAFGLRQAIGNVVDGLFRRRPKR